MILRALVDYYNTLVRQGKIARPGWSRVKISWALDLEPDGSISSVQYMKVTPDKGKPYPQEMTLPAPVKKTSGERSNFLWENAEYLIGYATKDAPEKTKRKFETAKELHLSLLRDVDTPEANAVKSYFERWDPASDINGLFSEECLEDLRGGGNLTFLFEGRPIGDYPSLQEAWQKSYDEPEEGKVMIDLVTGQRAVAQKTHPAVKGVANAQSSGASLVSFNAEAYESYGKSGNQCESAPMSKETAFAYTSALNYLTANREHRQSIGDMTVVYWSKNGEEAYQTALDRFLSGATKVESLKQQDLSAIMAAIAHGDPVTVDGDLLVPSEDFYLLGIAPNAARLSIRFFYRGTFGDLVTHIRQHYEDINIVSDRRNTWQTMPVWSLLKEIQPPGKNAETPPQTGGDLLRAVMTGGRYPRTLFNLAMLRIRSDNSVTQDHKEHSVTRGRAAIIKAYLIRNTKTNPNYANIKEVTTVALNETSNYTPYVLGRLFAVLERIQQQANPGITATIKDRYFNSACSTPAAIFPTLLKLSGSHLKKIDNGISVYYRRMLGDLMNRLDTELPKTQSPEEQGTFILGYYHQTQKFYEKKQNTEETEND